MRIPYRILGPIEVAGGGVPRGRALSLLALLLVHRGAIVHVDQAVEELWEGAGPMHPRKAVHVVASRLRSALGEGAVRSVGGGYAVPLAPGDLDADRFEGLFRRGREELAAGEPAEAAATLRLALSLWRGPALADVCDQRFAQPEIARLEELRLACLGDRVEADLALGEHAELVGELDALVRQHPLRERLRGQQMLALYRADRQAEALDAYRDAHQALVDGLGIEPSPALRSLQAAILRHDLPGRAPAPAPRAPLDVDARRRVTCAFAQLAHADGRAELDAESLRTVLERFHDTARLTCAAHGGTVAELRNDAVLAVFGAPVAHEDDAQRALRATAELVARTDTLPFGVRARCGVGTGVVVAPGRGAGSGPIIGEAVSSAERLARAAAGGEIRLDEPTWQLVRHAARADALADGGYRLDDLDAGAPAIHRRLDRPLIGREHELGRLRAAFDRTVASNAPALMAILGEPGIGKSHLAAQLPAVAGDVGRVLAGRCPAYGEGVTYWPLREIVEQARGERSADELAAELEVPPAVVHQVVAAVGLAPGTAGDDPAGALLQLVGALARQRPVIVVVDDAHLAEPALLELLLDVVARVDEAPLLVVLVARPDLLERHPSTPARIGPDSVLELGPLSDGASAALLASIAAGRLQPGQRRLIARAAGGNPLFLEQLVAYVDEQRSSTETLPPALHALLAARLDRLDTAERSALALGAIAGDAFETAAVHALAEGITRVELERACDRLVERDLLLPSDPGAERQSLRFRHALVREAAYASLAKAARARLHERHAAWLDGLGPALPEADARIGFHLETACRYAAEVGGGASAELASRTSHRLAAAARVARGRGDLLGEIGFLDRAVMLLSAEQEGDAALLPALVSALSDAGSSDRAESLAERAVAMSAALRMPGAGARSAIERERLRLHRHPDRFDVRAAVAVVEESTATLRGLGDELGLARAAYMMSDLTWMTGDPVAAHGHAERMLGHARRAGSGFDVATALIFMAWALVEGPWPAAEAIARCDALAEHAAGQPAAELSLRGCRGVLEVMAGGRDAARRVRAEARLGLAELHLGEVAAYLALLDAMAETLAGDAAAAERAVRDAEAMVADTGNRWYRAMVEVDLALALLALDRLEDAAAAVARVEALAVPGDSEWVVKRHMARAGLAGRRGEPARGLVDARLAVAAAERTGLIVCCADAHRTLAELLWAAGRTDEAATAVGHALALDEAKGNVAAATTTRRRFAPLVAAVST